MDIHEYLEYMEMDEDDLSPLPSPVQWHGERADIYKLCDYSGPCYICHEPVVYNHMEMSQSWREAVAPILEGNDRHLLLDRQPLYTADGTLRFEMYPAGLGGSDGILIVPLCTGCVARLLAMGVADFTPADCT